MKQIDEKTIGMTDEEKEELIKVLRDTTMDKLDKMQKLHKNQMLGAAQEMYIMYESFQKAGFTKKEAMELLKHSMTIGLTTK